MTPIKFVLTTAINLLGVMVGGGSCVPPTFIANGVGVATYGNAGELSVNRAVGAGAAV